MKIVNRKTFLSLPSGTVYCKYNLTGNFEELAVKESESGEYGNDWVCTSLYGDVEINNCDDFVDKMERYEKGEEFRFSHEEAGRDGFFDEDQLFAVYDQEDIKQLIDRLQKLNK
jgi:hypothetical protein